MTTRARPSTAGASPMDLNTRPRATGSLGPAGPEAAGSEAGRPGSSSLNSPGGNSGGNNTRSFRFLLTLALRKAQTAVTLDNGGHVEEAIRTYREAISMLGLVLSRTNEEDGRQRLLHF
ncbi:hypothetical protein EC988_006243, partial [Linderina pennispora]